MTEFRRAVSWLREPLVHFLLAGAVIFAAFGNAAESSADRTITVGEAQVRGIVEDWQQTWHRLPTPPELDGLIRDYVKDEVYYREALRLNLDKDDIVMRRRMRAKMEFLVAAQVENEVPDDRALQAWLDGHSSAYANGGSLSFDQLYIGPDATRAPGLRDALSRGADPASLGSPLSVPSRFDATMAEEIDRQLGDGFAKRVSAQPINTWSGPIQSGFGQHLVRVRKIVPGTVPPLASIRKAVENDWREANRTSREAKAYQALLDGYTIKIAKP